MPEQKWECEKCGKKGVVPYEKHADVFTVINDIADDHQRVSPDCDQSYRMLRIIKN